MSTLKFDPIDYARQLRSVGVSQDQADIQAQTIEKIISDIATSQDLVTKRDLVELKLELIKWMLGIGVAGIVSVAGILKYKIH